MSENNDFNMNDLHTNNQSYSIPNYTQNTQPQQNGNSGFAIASLVLGIFGILCCAGCCGIIFSILAVVFYFVDKSKTGVANPLAKAGLICGIIGIACTIIVFVLSFLAGLTGFFEDYTNQI